MTPPPDTHPSPDQAEDLTQRLARAERGIALACAIAAIYCAVRALGFPNHLYQWSLGLALVAMAYHAGFFRLSLRIESLLMIPLNVVLMATLTKLVIGGGIRFPFFWVRYPTVQFAAPADKWYSILPKTDLGWIPSDLAHWSIDLTVVQSFLAVITAFTALIRFQPFASMVALLLVLFSIPSLMEFQWPLVFPSLLLSGVAFYLQTPQRRKTISL